MGKAIIKKFGELNKEQKTDVRRRFKSPYTGYLYKITKVGNVHYRQKQRQT